MIKKFMLINLIICFLQIGLNSYILFYTVKEDLINYTFFIEFIQLEIYIIIFTII